MEEGRGGERATREGVSVCVGVSCVCVRVRAGVNGRTRSRSRSRSRPLPLPFSQLNSTHLVSAHDAVKVKVLTKAVDDVRSKNERDAAIIVLPPPRIGVRVGPHEVAEEANIRHVSGAAHVPDLIEAP